MILRGWRVDGFGILNQVEISDLPDGLVVVHGPNEAGKSTLLRFLHAMLFARWSSSGAGLGSPPIRGGAHGGQLTVEKAGARWTLTRHARRGGLQLLGPDGQQKGDADWQELLSHADGALFDHVFAFDLDALSESRTLQAAEIRDRLFSAGVAGAGVSAQRAMKRVDDAASLLLAPRKEATINRLAQQLSALDERLAAAQAQQHHYGELVAAEQQHQAERRDLQAEQQQLVARSAHLAQVRTCAPLLAQKSELQQTIAQLEAELVGRSSLDEVALQRLLTDGNALVERVRRADELDQELALSEGRLAVLRRQLGASWNDERLEAFVVADTLWSEIDEHSAAQRDAEQRLDELQAARTDGDSSAPDPVDRWMMAFVLAAALLAAGGAVLTAHRWFALVAVALVVVAVTASWLRRRDRATRQRRRAVVTQQADARRARARHDWEGWLTANDLPPRIDPSRARQLLLGARDASETLRGIARQRVERQRLLSPMDPWLESSAATLANAGLVPAETLEARLDQLQELIDRARTRQARELTLAEQQRQLQSVEQRLVRGLSALADPQAVLNDAARQETEAWELEATGLGLRQQQLLDRVSETERELTTATARRQELERSVLIAELELQRAATLGELSSALDEWRTLRLTSELIATTLRDYQSRHQPDVLRDASSALAQLTEGRHRAVVQEGADGIAVVGDGGRVLPEQLSRGTREQLYLAVRLGLAQHLARQGIVLPFVMDDILVNFDPARQAAAARLVAQLAQSHQVLFFTCHPETVARLRAAAPNLRLVSIE